MVDMSVTLRGPGRARRSAGPLLLATVLALGLSGCSFTSLWAWGASDLGQVGTGTSADQPNPVPVGGTTWRSLSAGGQHACGLRADNRLWCWGYNATGQVGDRTTTNRSTPVAVGSASWKSIAAGSDHTGAIRSDDTLWCWGQNNFGQVGDGSTTNR